MYIPPFRWCLSVWSTLPTARIWLAKWTLVSFFVRGSNVYVDCVLYLSLVLVRQQMASFRRGHDRIVLPTLDHGHRGKETHSARPSSGSSQRSPRRSGSQGRDEQTDSMTIVLMGEVWGSQHDVCWMSIVQVMIALLGTYTAKDAGAAQSDARECVRTAVVDPKSFSFDHLVRLDAVQQLQKVGRDSGNSGTGRVLCFMSLQSHLFSLILLCTRRLSCSPREHWRTISSLWRRTRRSSPRSWRYAICSSWLILSGQWIPDQHVHHHHHNKFFFPLQVKEEVLVKKIRLLTMMSIAEKNSVSFLG